MSATCPACGHVAPGDPDFCPSCGEYLRWEPTGQQQAVEPAPVAGHAASAAAAPPARPSAPASPGARSPAPAAPAAPAPQPAAPEAVLLALRRADDEGYAGEPLTLAVQPGGAVTFRALVRNQSGIVDNYDMAVDGLPEGWSEVDPATVYLVPFGAAGGSYEQEVEIRLTPPRSPDAEARAWEIAVVATSRAHGTAVRSAPATVEIAPYSELETALTPERRSGRLEASFSLAVTNRANAPVEVGLNGVDPEERLGFAFREPFVPRQAARSRPDAGDLAVRAYRRGEALAGQGGVEEIGRRAVRRATAGAEGRLVGFLRRRKRVGREIDGLRLAPGEQAEVVVAVTPPKQIWLGRSVLHPFQVTVQPAGADAPGPPAAGTFRQRQWLPWWLAIVVPLIVLGAVWLLSTRASEATVPDLSTAPDVFAAKALLEGEGFTLGETFEEPVEGAAAGAIVEQTPAAGETAEEGTAVSVKVSVGAEKAAVPDLTGQTTDAARAALQAAGFQLGRPLNEPADPPTATIVNQIPVPDTLEPAGTAVDVVYAESEAAGAEEGAGTAGAPAAPPSASGGPPPPVGAEEAPAGAPPAGQTGGGAPAIRASGAPVPLPAAPGAPVPQPSPPTAGGGVTVPELTGKRQGEASDALAGLGLVPGVLSAVSADAPAGSVLAQEPGAGTEVAPGATIVITVSRGYPAVVHDADGDIVRIGGATGEPVERVAASDEIEEQPSASFATPLIAYRRGPQGSRPGVAPSGRIWVVDAADPRSARPLTDGGFDDRRPAISPDGAVVALASNRGGRADDYDLCFTPIATTGRPPACIRDADVNVSRPAWSPDGSAILVTASDGPQTELLLYTSARPSSPEPADWTDQGLLTDGMHGERRSDQVLSSAFSPDGTRLAFTANWTSRTFTLWTIPVGTGVVAEEAEQHPFIAGCELAWRPDGVELVIAQRNSTCDERGRIVRVDPAAPNAQTLLSRLDLASGSPAWSPPAPG